MKSEKPSLKVLEIRTESAGLIDLIDVTGKDAKEINKIKKRWGHKTKVVGKEIPKMEETKFIMTIGKYILDKKGKLKKK